MNKAIAFNCRNPQRYNIICGCYTTELIVHINQEESSKPFNIFHISKMFKLFLKFVLVDEEKGNDNTYVLSIYWLIELYDS